MVALYAEGRENETLHALRAGLAALRCGELALAAQLFDRAITDVDALHAGARQAQRAQSKFVREQEKWFKGEAYERSAAFLYRGLLYLAANDFGNAAACFKRVQLHDITGDDAPGFAGDWYSAEWALAFASYHQGFPAEADQALARAAQFSTRAGNVPPPQPAHNVLLVVESGTGPVKYRTGRYGEQLRYRPGTNPVTEIEVVQHGQCIARSAPAERLTVQATTRGTRQVDYILAGKAQFKEGMGTAAAALGMGAVVVSDHDRRGVATSVLMGLAALSAVASAATTPEADIRAWNNLPEAIYLIGLQLPAGSVQLQVRGRDATGAVKKTTEVSFALDAGTRVQVIFVRL